MKKAMVLIALVLMASAAFAQSASGTLTVSGTVDGTIQLVFSTAPSSVALGGSGTSAATLAFGNVSRYGTIATAGVNRTVAANSFSVSTDFNVQVNVANDASTQYNLTVAGSAPVAAGTPSFSVSSGAASVSAIDSTAKPFLNAAGIGTAIPVTLTVDVPDSYTVGTISNVLTFAATAI